MPEPCQTCGHKPEPSPADWLDADELALVEFLDARLQEHRNAVEEHTLGSARDVAIVAADLTASAAGVMSAYAWTRDPDRRAVIRPALLLLSQPWVEHPDYRPEWTAALHALIGA